LKNLSERLSSADFIRVHRSYIIPVTRISHIRNRMIFIHAEDKMIELPIGRSYEDEVYKIFN
jgi:DNA-binding LytR/AlgR family response regulator